MRPIEQTITTAEELSAYVDQDVMVQLQAAADRVEQIVPDVVGLSLAISDPDSVTLTLVASDEQVALLDALQYLGGGPCVEALETGVGIASDLDDPMDEQRWQWLGRVSGTRGIASTLSMPILAAGAVVGTLNLYGGSVRSFEGHHEQIAAIFGAWAPAAVTNADLSFRSRLRAEASPALLRGSTAFHQAVGIIAEVQGLSVEDAARHLRESAARADLLPEVLAEAFVERFGGGGGPSAGRGRGQCSSAAIRGAATPGESAD